MRTHFLIYFILLAMLAGCSTKTPKERGDRVFRLHRSSYMAILYYFNQPSASKKVTLRVSGKTVGNIRPGHYLKVYLAPGRYQLQRQGSSEELALMVRAGENIYITGEVSFDLVDRAEAVKVLSKLTQIKPLLARAIDPANATFISIEWYLFRRKNTIKGYRQYLRLARGSPYTEEALWRIRDLQAIKDGTRRPAPLRQPRRLVKRAAPTTKLKAKLKTKPKMSAAKRQQEIIAFEQATVMNSKNAYMDFLKLFPRGNHADEAFRRMLMIVYRLPLAEREKQLKRIFRVFPQARKYVP